MITRVVRMHFHADKVEEFLQLFQASQAHIRAMPGCLSLQLLADAQQPAVFYTLSTWASQQHLDAYRDSPLFGQVWPATKKLFADKPLAFSMQAAPLAH